MMSNLWLIPFLPLLAAGLCALAKQPQRVFAASLAIGAMGLSFLLSCAAFVSTLQGEGMFRQTRNFDWFDLGTTTLQLGFVLDPLSAVMLVMVTLVGLLIFIYSVGYMAPDRNFTRFFCFLSLFAAAMLGLVISNSLLLLFICWELVGVASYLLIGFWFEKPSAAAAARKAFITTRIGDMGFLLGLLWLYAATGTLLFYDGGAGCLESTAVTQLAAQTTAAGMAASTGIGLLIFCGAIGKSGQLPLHVWLPDAMEGPTPVSALIHAATMVAAGVFLVARVYPLMSGQAAIGAPGEEVFASSAALTVVTWVGVSTAVFAACIAVAQTDIKRILAYSTVSQLGYMMMGLGVGGVAVGLFHLITHAFFKALLFLGAGSVIHGAHGAQDIRQMGGLKKYMPVTFATYAVGMMALAGVPLFFSGFWSKDEILHSAHGWQASHAPFYLGLFGALLTAFYMMRQVCYVFFGKPRMVPAPAAQHAPEERPKKGKSRPGVKASSKGIHDEHTPHESPAVMTWPLLVLAFFAVTLGFLGTPAWPWFQSYVTGQAAVFGIGALFRGDVLLTMGLSTLAVAAGLWLGWSLYGARPARTAAEVDPLERLHPGPFSVLRDKFYVDEFYGATVLRASAWWAGICDWLDRSVWTGVVQAVSFMVLGLSWLSRLIDEYVVNLGFDKGCAKLREGGGLFSRVQSGQVQSYLRIIGISSAVLVLLLVWGWRS
jgi:NADH-quinone oxidoreductase subunit L